LRRFFGLPPAETEAQSPQGSGVIVSAEGHIVTNLHVVQDAGEILVALNDGRKMPARLLGADPLSDIAVLKIEADGLRALSFADSEKVRVGQLVFAVGSPFGLQETITHGIISAKERLFSSESVNEFFQTDAAINRGNSGGPLVNIRGEIVGLNNFILSESGGSQGLGFSIPANSVRRAFEQIVEHGRVLRPYLGVQSANLVQPGARGALLEKVLPGSPAEEAGLRPGDVITKFDGREIRDFNDLRKRVADAKIGGEVVLEIVRDGRTLGLPVTMVEMQRPGGMPLPPPPSGGVVPQPVPPPSAAPGALAGVEVRELTPALIRRHRLPENIQGVLVQAVAPGSPAEGILQPGDAIEQVDDTPVASPADFQRAVAAIAPGERVILLLSRGRVRSFEVVGP
jgi:serine protease Do